MPLTTLQLDVRMGWSEEKEVAGFGTNLNNDSLASSVSPDVSSTAAREIYYVRGTLSAGASVVFDLSAITGTLYGASLAPTGAYCIVVEGTGASWKWDVYSSNQMYGFFTSVPGVGINGGDGAVFAFGDRTPWTINSTAKNARITHTGTSGTLTYRFSIALKTA